MKLEIDKSKVKAIFTFTPEEYFLVLSRFDGQEKEWALCPRIDRSKKGKDDDIGSPVLFLEKTIVPTLKENGFSYVDLTEINDPQK